MSKGGVKRDFACVHSGCGFKSDKRKAIVTHLLRTHNERKEDFECEYCDTLFEEEAVIEEHLYTAHPGFQFRYTCVSRLETLLNKCAQLAADRKKSVALKSHNTSNVKNKTPENNAVTDKTVVVSEPPCDSASEQELKPLPRFKPLPLKESSQKRKASVNESLNYLAKLPRITVPENPLTAIKQEPLDIEPDLKAENDTHDFVNEDEAATFVSKPSGLKIKLNLKKIRASCERESSTEPQNRVNPPNSTLELREMSPLAETDLPQSVVSVVESDNSVPGEADFIEHVKGPSVAQGRSKYFDKLEVYHTTDEFNRRCCPFCDYKTTKNTIRVHLSGKHKIYFVMCSLCDYRAAFPYQVQTHGFSCHKIRDIEVIHLAKSYREGVIAKIKAGLEPDEASVSPSVKPAKVSEVTRHGIDNDEGDSMIYEEGSVQEAEELISTKTALTDTRVFKPPVCQTSKTDYYSIIFENNTYLYCCSQCDFRTPVRATIYTHKYRHDDKAYKCGYCNFISAPKSNVVHHIRWKHKGKAFEITETVGLDQLKQSGVDTDGMSADSEDMANLQEGDSFADESKSQELTMEQDAAVDIATDAIAPFTEDTSLVEQNQTEINSPSGETKPQKTIIKVPQYKRTLTSSGVSAVPVTAGKTKNVGQGSGDFGDSEGKMSLNKLYRYNPKGTPKYMCNECPYACDTHPKMKHHLYRHKPQRYKCPYCNHRKYPRSYVIRHVRDTHRDKPVKVVDLLKTEKTEADLEYDMMNGTDDMVMNTTGLEASDNDANSEQTSDKTGTGTGVNYLMDNISGTGQPCFPGMPDNIIIKQEPVDTSTSASEETMSPYLSNSRPTSEMSKLESPNLSTINRPLFNSTPIAGSALFEASPSSEKPPKKPVKNYDVNTKRKPRYICNFCQYGTENYKTIHNHMYRHEPLKYLCPYCGFKRAPRSFVENHIREVHKGQLIIVTEVVDEDAMNMDLSGNSGLNRKEPLSHTAPSVLQQALQKNTKIETPTSTNKTSGTFPAPKPASKLSISPPEMPPLHIPVKKKALGSTISPIIPTLTVPTRPVTKSVGPPNVTISSSSQVPIQQTQEKSPPMISVTKPVVKSELTQQTVNHVNDAGAVVKPNGITAMPTYKDGGKTTFKTMYKCVFDPETCNHISKDRSKMKQHIFMHVEYKPWSCDYCSMTASQSSHVKNHVRAEHPESEISFHYQKHNYLEKHIDGFLQKGVFTVPVSEYRFIMDMKGSSKKQQFEYARDTEGYLLCPHCEYRTKSGGMADHVKMKHMQPRFKCHWCDFKAFYRSEVRKHHRKERGHAHLEFKTQELDLVEVMEEYKEGSGDIPDALQSSTYLPISADDTLETGDASKDDMSDDFDMDDDASSNADSAISDSTALSGSLADSPFLHLNIPYSFEGIDAGDDDAQPTQVKSREESVDQYNVGTLNNAGSIGSKAAEYKKEKKGTNAALYKCGYCLFSARLRTMVKMHCQKQHPYRKVHCIEPKLRISRLENAVSDNKYDITDSDGQLSSDTKVDSFNITKPAQSSLQLQPKEFDISELVPVLQHPKPVPKKSKSLKSVIDQLSSKAKQKGDVDVHAYSNNESDNINHEPNNRTTAYIKNDNHFSASAKNDGTRANYDDDISLCAKNDSDRNIDKVNTSTYVENNNDLNTCTKIHNDIIPSARQYNYDNTDANSEDCTGETPNEHETSLCNDKDIRTHSQNPIDINTCSDGDTDIKELAKLQVDADSANNHIIEKYTIQHIQQINEQSMEQTPHIFQCTQKREEAMQEQTPETGNVQESEISPPVLTNELREDENIVQVAETKEDDINPPLLINEAEKSADAVTVKPLECETLADPEDSALEITAAKTGDILEGSVSVQKGENESGSTDKEVSSKYSSSKINENCTELDSDNQIKESPLTTEIPDLFSLQNVSDKTIKDTNAQGVNKLEDTNALNGYVDSTSSSVSEEGMPENGYPDGDEGDASTSYSANVNLLKTKVLNAGSCFENGSINKGIGGENNKLNERVVSQPNACEKDASTD